MGPPESSGPFSGICYEDSLPLRFAPGPIPEPALLAGINADNFQLLIADASLDETRVPSSESKTDDDSQVIEDLRRLEHKVNVLIQLVAKLVASEQALPDAVPWRLYGAGVEWRSSTAPAAPHASGVLSLYISRQFPQPLRLPGTLAPARVDEHGSWQRLVFEGLTAPVTEGLERLIFRHHRRAVAGVRTQHRE